MIDLDVLDRAGCSAAKLKPVFEQFYAECPDAIFSSSTSKPQAMTDRHKRLACLQNRMRSRIDNGRDWNFKNQSVFSALDMAWNLPFRQTSPTLLASMENEDIGEIKSKLDAWGIKFDDIISTQTDPKSGKPITTLDLPAFYRVFVPLVRSYGTIRWAKIVNDRRRVPHFKYEPAFSTKKRRAQCEILTNRVEIMSRQFGYFEVMKQAVFQMLHYGTCLQFPREQWYAEHQILESGPAPTPVDNPISHGQPDTQAAAPTAKGAKGTVVKEGVRYNMPHPSKMFWDQAHRPSTFNSDSGCEYAGYWRVVRYGEIAGNSKFWAAERVGFNATGTPWWQKENIYLKNVHGCAMNWPTTSSDKTGNSDREDRLAWGFYNTAEMNDTACTVTEYFEKIIPSEYGLGDYNHPVWFRFIVAGDTATIIYAAPLPYCPVVAYLYDPDENRDTQASLSLEVLPFQDQLSNLFSQYILTVQQNLTNATLIDTDMVDEKDVKKMENAGEQAWRSRLFIRYSGRSIRQRDGAMQAALQSVQFAPLNTQDIISAMRTTLDMLERVLVMSAQEVAQAASHEQTREEVRHIAQNTSTRLRFTEIPVDLATEAWKRQLYSALMAYGSEEFYSYVSYDKDVTDEVLKELGFTVLEKEEANGSKRAIVKGNKSKMGSTAPILESFAATHEIDRASETEAGAALMQLIGQIANSEYAMSLGADQLFQIINTIGHRTGVLDKDFKLVPKFDPTPIMKKRAEMEASGAKAQAAQPQQQVPQGEGLTPDMLKQILMDLEKRVLDQVGQAIQPIGQAVQQHEQAIQEIGKAMEGIGPMLQQIMAGVAQVNQKADAAMQMSQQNSEAINALASMTRELETHVINANQAAPDLGGPPSADPSMGLQPGIALSPQDTGVIVSPPQA